MSLKLTDLRVLVPSHPDDLPRYGSFRTATPADIVEVAASLPGAKKLWRCVDGEQSLVFFGVAEPPPHFAPRTGSKIHTADCGWRLVIPLEDET